MEEPKLKNEKMCLAKYQEWINLRKEALYQLEGLSSYEVGEVMEINLREETQAVLSQALADYSKKIFAKIQKINDLIVEVSE